MGMPSGRSGGQWDHGRLARPNLLARWGVGARRKTGQALVACSRSPDGAQRNPGAASRIHKESAGCRRNLDSAALHPGYELNGDRAAVPGRSRWQCLQTMASGRIHSAQKGHLMPRSCRENRPLMKNMRGDRSPSRAPPSIDPGRLKPCLEPGGEPNRCAEQCPAKEYFHDASRCKDFTGWLTAGACLNPI